MSRRRNKYVSNVGRTVAMNTTELVGLQVGGTLVGGMTGPGAAIGGAALGTGFGLAGVSGLTNTAFGKGGVLDSLGSLGGSTKRRRRRR